MVLTAEERRKGLPEMCLTKFFHCDHSSSITVDGPLGSHSGFVCWSVYGCDDVDRRNKHGQSGEEETLVIMLWGLL